MTNKPHHHFTTPRRQSQLTLTCLTQFQHRQRPFSATREKPPQFDRYQKVSPAPKPTKPSRIWQRPLKAHGLALTTKRFAFRLPLCQQACLYLKTDFGTPKAARLCPTLRALRLAVSKPYAHFASILPLRQAALNLPRPKGKLGSRQTGLRSFFKVPCPQTTTRLNSLVIVLPARRHPKPI